MAMTYRQLMQLVKESGFEYRRKTTHGDLYMDRWNQTVLISRSYVEKSRHGLYNTLAEIKRKIRARDLATV